MFGYKDMSEIVSEFCNCAAGISGAYETPAKSGSAAKTLTGETVKDTKPIDWEARLKNLHIRRGE